MNVFHLLARSTALEGRRRLLVLVALVVALLVLAGVVSARSVQTVADVETDPVPSDGDAADDPAIWIHPTDTSLSLVIGTDKDGGLAVYDLSGTELQYLSDIAPNNVDLRYNFPLGEESVALVAATDELVFFKVDPQTRTLVDVTAGTFDLHDEYGLCMYRSPTTGSYYAFVTYEDGVVQQWELFDDGTGRVDAAMVREFDVGEQVEGCAADDVLGHLYLGEESRAIWKYGAEPDDGTARVMVDEDDGHFDADVEGLTIYYAGDGTGYLIASSQGSDEFIVYRREGDNEFVGAFEIDAGETIDAVTHTDGIDVANLALGEAFPHGVFIAQDDDNFPENQNFKLVPWDRIAKAFAPPLTVDTTWDPRTAGATDCREPGPGHPRGP